MNNKYYEMGQQIANFRKKKSISCSEFAKSIGISTAYLSQLERGIRLHPDSKLISKIARALDLSNEESTYLFDLYAMQTRQLPPDITEYLIGNSGVQSALRKARDANATEEDWERFIEKLKK